MACSALQTLDNLAVAIPSLSASRVEEGAGLIERGERDEFGQPLDKRERNSWSARIEEVGLAEEVENRQVVCMEETRYNHPKDIPRDIRLRISSNIFLKNLTIVKKKLKKFGKISKIRIYHLK